MLNTVPTKFGISEKISLSEIIMGRELDTTKDLGAYFELYIEASHDTVVTNDMSNRTHPYMALDPSGNM